MSITPAEQDRLLRKALKRELEQRGYFVKFSQDGGCTVLRGETGGEQTVIDSGLSVLDAGKKYGLWGEDNNRETREQLMNPTTSPDGTGRPTPFAVATLEKNRKDSQEVNKSMSNKPKSAARQRASELIFDYKTQSGAFSNVFNGSSTTGPAEDHSPAPAKSTKAPMSKDRARFNEYMDDNLQHVPSDTARQRMIDRQAEHHIQDTSAYLNQIARERWSGNGEGRPRSSISPYRKEKT